MLSHMFIIISHPPHKILKVWQYYQNTYTLLVGEQIGMPIWKTIWHYPVNIKKTSVFYDLGEMCIRVYEQENS